LGAVGLAFRAEVRRRWRSWTAIAVLISVVGGLVLAAAAAGRRTESAFPRFVSAHGFDVVIYANRPVPKIATLRQVASATEITIPDTGNPTCSCSPTIAQANLSVAVVAPGARSPFTLVSGRLPDPSAPDQVLASFTLEQHYGVGVGTLIRVPFEAPSQAAAYNNPNIGLPPPRGPTVALHVVGIEASEVEFPSGTTPVYFLYASRAFARTVLPRTGVEYQYLVRLHDGAAGVAGFNRLARSLNLGKGDVGFSSEDGTATAIEGSIRPQALGWWILAALAALVGLAVVGQALGRQSIVESEDYPTMAALGLDRRQLVSLGTARNLLLGLLGAAGAVAVATALSPIAPLGEARLAEATTGVTFDALVLPLGGLAVVAVVVALGAWPALRAARAVRPDDLAADSHRSAVAAVLAGAGAPPSAVIGVRSALERRSGGATVPLGSALLGTVLAVIALCATAVFGASLSHLTATPALYGDPAQLSFYVDGGTPSPAFLRSLEHNPAVTAVTTGVGAGELAINKVPVGAVVGTSARGPLLFSTVDGHLPQGDDQIGLGASTMRAVGAHLGSVVELSFPGRPGSHGSQPFRVVSQLSLPLVGGFVSLGTGALLTTAGLEHAACPAGGEHAICVKETAEHSNDGILARFVSGPRGQRAIDHYLAADQGTRTVIPTSLVNFGEAVNFPLLFGAMLAVFGAATLAHLLVVSVSRRRREIGLLKVLGFVNRQVVSAVSWQATTLALVGILIGVPVGLAVGQAVWKFFANYLGAVPVSVVPTWLIGVLVVGVLVVANVIAIAPAVVATRSKPGDLLRTS
jgi:hypothetical protein